MVDFTIALFLQLGLLVLLGRLLPAGKKGNAGGSWSPSLPGQPSWEGAQRMIEREYGASSLCGGHDDEE
jgi:hypothetical protein